MNLCQRPLLSLLFLFLGIQFSEAALAQSKWADEYTMAEKIEMGKPYHGEYAAMVEPFTVIGNIHSIGARDIGVFLITTGEGHILLDTGTPEMHEGLLANIQALGFRPQDIRIMISTHAHFDHIQGHEAMRQVTGAKVYAIGEDAKALRLGEDISPLGFEGWTPVREVTTIDDGDTVGIGGVVLTAHLVPGHTQGCTVWSMEVDDHGSPLNVAFFGCTGPNAMVRVVDNPDFPDLATDTLLGYERMRAMPVDLYLRNHPAGEFKGRVDAIRDGVRPHPLLEQRPWPELIDLLESRFRERLSNQSKGADQT